MLAGARGGGGFPGSVSPATTEAALGGLECGVGGFGGD